MSLRDIDFLLKTYKAIMVNQDIQSAIDGNCPYLAALGLSTNTEVPGGLYKRNLVQNQGQNNYECFIQDFFPPDYNEVDKRLKNAVTKMGYMVW
jgi:hypothetical protein